MDAVRDVLDENIVLISVRGVFCLALAAVFSGGILYNALISQAGLHSAPLGASWPQNAASGKLLKPPTAVAPASTLPNSSVSKVPMGGSGAAALNAVMTSGMLASLQEQLGILGLYAGTADGRNNDATRAAINTYQTVRGLPVTGQASAGLLDNATSDAQFLKASRFDSDGVAPKAKAAAIPASVPQRTATTVDDGERQKMKTVQQVLAELGYSPGPADGIPGEQTRQALLQFQRDRSLPATGRIDPTLMAELGKVTGQTSLTGQ